MRLISILMLGALLVYCSPLRVCFVQQAVAGTSCHQPPRAAPDPPQNCPPHSQGGDAHDCVCQAPKGAPDRSNLTNLPIDLHSPPAQALRHMCPIVVGSAYPSAPSAPVPAPPERSLPLLN